MFTSPRYRINGKSVNTLSENVETSTALIVTSQEVSQKFPRVNYITLCESYVTLTTRQSSNFVKIKEYPF